MFGAAGFQNLLSPSGTETELLFYWIMSQMLLVALGVFLMMSMNYLKGGLLRLEKPSSYHELTWTFLPSLVLGSVALPSLTLLYGADTEGKGALTIKITGHQWYWSYDYSSFSEVILDSFLATSEELELGDSRYLEADNHMVAPSQTPIECVIGSVDVLHALALPPLGIKVDATPGRLTSVLMELLNVGLFLGQCSELCGANHSFMPIVVESVTSGLFKEWLNSWAY